MKKKKKKKKTIKKYKELKKKNFEMVGKNLANGEGFWNKKGKKKQKVFMALQRKKILRS